MSIIRVDATQVSQVRRLWQRSRYLYHNLGAEDLTALLTKQVALLAEESGQPWGFICLHEEPRPATLPTAAPTRVYLRALALTRGRAPAVYVTDLVNAAISHLRPSMQGHLLIAYADADWVRMPLFQAGFTLAEEVQFLEFAQVQRWRLSAATPQPSLHLHPGQVADLEALAALDAAAFTPLWHFDATALHELLMTGRLQVASAEGGLIGYTALTTSDRHAHLARLAVHPHMQRRGIGKFLLEDVLRYAQTAGVETMLLNTQVHNHTAQHLYRAVGFRPTGRITPVLTLQMPPANQPPHASPAASTTDSTPDVTVEVAV
ncbi:MAG: GNAT family N-acetyltransferase [Caldilineaceae bacterium]